jgi:hypothetical protein
MKYHAVLFMCNDEERARFVIENFQKHNPEIKLTVYNGGNSVSESFSEYDIELIEGDNLWHKKTRHAPVSFSYEWFEMLFVIYEKHKPEYLIFLETDVKTNRKIEIEPKYDVSGPVVSCGYMEQLVMYDYWGNYLNNEPFEEDRRTKWQHKFHTGMGATAFSKNFFEKSKNNLHLVKQCYELIPFNCYQDVIITLLGRYSGCSMGDWSEVSDTRGTLRKVSDTQWYFEAPNEKCALIHNFKV